MKRLKLGLVGDYDANVTAHRAIPIALANAAQLVNADVDAVWLRTSDIADDAPFAELNGIWCVPASPYASMGGALRAIRFAREHNVPFLGTCGGFQHTVLEYARNVMGFTEAEHEETAPDAPDLVISRLACSLIDVEGEVRFLPGSRLEEAYGSTVAREEYRCSFGLNPDAEA